jgi:predicted RNase H-like HicB family nuclease
MTYTVVLYREPDGRYSVSVPALKGCHTEGESLAHAILMAEEVIALYLESLRDRGKSIPEDVETFSMDMGEATEALVCRLTVKEAAVAA